MAKNKRDKIKDELDQLEVDYDGRSSTEDLEALLEEHKGGAEESASDEEGEESTDEQDEENAEEEEGPAAVELGEEANIEPEGDLVDLVNGANEYIRYYSKQDHGEDFKKIAERVAQREGYTVLPEGKLRAVRVRYRRYNRQLEAYVEQAQDFSERGFREESFRFNTRVKGTRFALY